MAWENYFRVVKCDLCGERRKCMQYNRSACEGIVICCYCAARFLWRGFTFIEEGVRIDILKEMEKEWRSNPKGK